MPIRGIRALGNLRGRLPGGSVEGLRFTRDLPPSPFDEAGRLARRPRPFYEEPLTEYTPSRAPRVVQGESGADIFSPIVPGRKDPRVTLRPLNRQQNTELAELGRQDPLNALGTAENFLYDAANPEQFAVALQAVASIRRGLKMNPTSRPMRALDQMIEENAVRLGVPRDVVETAPLKNTAARARGIFDDALAQDVRPDERAVFFTSSVMNKLKTAEGSAPSLLRSINSYVIDPQGGAILKMLSAGQIDQAQANYLFNHADKIYRSIAKNAGVYVPKGKGMKALSDARLSKLPGAERSRVYQYAMNTAESQDELAAISTMWRNDIRNLNYIDELDMVEGIASARINRVGDVKPWQPVTSRGSRGVDEQSVRRADTAQRDLDAARFEATRPEGQGPIIRDVTPTGEASREATGTVRRRRLDYSRTPGGVDGNPGRSPLPMWIYDGYTDPSGITYRMRPEYRGKTTMDLIFDGNRTATTRDRRWRVKTGDIIDFVGDDGVVARVEVTKAPYQLPAPQSQDHLRRLGDRWSELEGWEPSLYNDMVGKWQFQYRLLGS